MERLEIRVNNLMLKGYKPQGGISLVTETHEQTVFYSVFQAMIKEN